MKILGLLILLPLAAACQSTDSVQAAAPPPQASEQAFIPEPLDEIPAKVSSLHLLKASGNESMINGYYDYLRPDISHLTHKLPRLGPPRPFDQYDVHLFCNRGWPFELNGEPLCDKGAKMSKAGARPICIYQEERHAPRGVDPLGASVAWTDNGQCAVEFKHGLVGTPTQMKQVIAVAMEAATWMDRFVKPASGPSSAEGLDNRRLLHEQKEIE